MEIAPKPADEDQRLRALKRLHLLDTGAEAEFDALVALAAIAIHTPIALISLVDEGRQWFKARTGLDAAQTSRAVSFCSHGILRSDPMIVCDATRDARFADNPLVTEAPNIRAYLGAPLVMNDGATIGMMCVCAHEPMAWTLSDAERIAELARLTVAAIEKRAARLHDEGLRVCAHCLDVCPPDEETWAPVEDFLKRTGGWSGPLVNALCPACAAAAQEVA